MIFLLLKKDNSNKQLHQSRRYKIFPDIYVHPRDQSAKKYVIEPLAAVNLSMTLETPQIYKFPPLYTPQSNKLIRKQQLQSWQSIILQSCAQLSKWCINRSGKIYDTETGQLIFSIFENTEINRSCNLEFQQEIWSFMIQNGSALPLKDSEDSNMMAIFWESLDSWSSLILEWCESSGKLNQVITIYEICESDENRSCKFYGMPSSFCQLVLQRLVDRGRATLLKDQGRFVGVKIV